MRFFLKPNVFAAALLISLPMMAQTSLVKPRIAGVIDNGERTTLAGSHPMLARAENDLGAVDQGMVLHGISLVLSRTAAQEAALQALLVAQQDPSSPQYHQWLTPDQFAAEFGVADADIAAAESWLQQQGFTVDGVSRSRNRITFSGTAAMVASAFGSSLHNYKMADGSTHFAPSSDLTVPTALSSIVMTVGNLSSFHPHALVKLNPQRANPQFTSSVSGNHFIGPGDIRVMYDANPVYQAGYTGVNQSIAVIGQSYVSLSDVTAFQSAAGITAKTPVLVLMPGTGTPAYSTGDEAESDLDLEYTSTMAPGAQVYLVYTGNSANYGAFNALEYAVDERIAPIISASYGECEPALGSTNQAQFDAALAQAAAQGQTVIAAAGDEGSTGCYGAYTTATANLQVAVDYPAVSTYVTAMGGTEIPTADAQASNSTYWTAANGSDVVVSAKSYIPEQVWNDDATYGSPDSGGGGVSIYESRPSWQTGVTVGGVAIPSGSYRLVPDISLVASNTNAPLIFCSSDTSAWATSQVSSCTNGFRDTSTADLTVAGGTSFDAPIFSGMLALINQALNSTGQGVINSTLYSLASNTTTYASAFHDITVGGNQCLSGSTICGTGVQVTDYAAATGYDEASGLGSIDLNNLLTAWPRTSAAALAETKTTLTPATAIPGSGATDAITITVAAVSGSVVPTGSVAVTVDGTSAGTLNLTSGSATYSFSSAVTGSHVVVATYAANGTFGASTGSTALNVGAVIPSGTFTLTASPASQSVAPGGSVSYTLTATPSAGYTGTVDLSFVYAPSTLNNFCAGDTGNSAIRITGTAAATDTVTFYTNRTTCTSLGLTVYQTGGGSTPVKLVRPRVTIGAVEGVKQGAPLQRAALPAALACLLLTFGLGRRSRLLKSKLVRAGLSLAFVALLSLGGFGLTACSNNAAPSSTVQAANYTTAGTYGFTLYGEDSSDPALSSQASVTMTVN